MAGILVLRVESLSRELLEHALGVFRQQNDGPEVSWSINGWQVVARGNGEAPLAVTAGKTHGIVVVGFITYRGKSSRAAAGELLRDLVADAVDEAALGGAFAAFSWDGGRLRFFTDWLGNLCAYRSASGTVWSTSFLATAAACSKLSFDDQGCWEYIFQGAPCGESTVLREVTRIDPEKWYYPCGRAPEPRSNPLPRQLVRRVPFDDAVDQAVASLQGIFEAIVDAHGDRIDTALSGGYDSRLILAALRAKGSSPRVHVYGNENDPDVVLARTIASGEGFDLHHVDKSTVVGGLQEDEVGQIIDRNFLFLDATPPDGIFEAADLRTRRDRMEGGFMALNGGGGEIFRNFYYLPDRRFRLRDLLSTFYSMLDRRACSDRFDLNTYLGRLRDKMLHAIHMEEEEKIERLDIERLYPLFRCRYWMAHNTSINNIIGKAMVPFMHVPAISAALAMPIRYKNHGMLEAAMIARLDPRLASYPSIDRSSLDRPPGVIDRVRGSATILRPIWIRRLIYPARMRFRSLRYRNDRTAYDRYRRFVPGDWEAARRWVLPERLLDEPALARAATLQYFANRLHIATV